MEPSAGTLVVKTPRFVVVAGADGVWALQGIRLRDGEAPGAVAEVRRLLPQAGTRVVSWWLSDRATPADVEEQLLDAGLELLADDYLLDGLLATTPPPKAACSSGAARWWRTPAAAAATAPSRAPAGTRPCAAASPR